MSDHVGMLCIEGLKSKQSNSLRYDKNCKDNFDSAAIFKFLSQKWHILYFMGVLLLIQTHKMT